MIFGIIGVVLFACILGMICISAGRMMKRIRNPVGISVYAQFAMYLVLSFFTTWFSNPATWFYLIVTGLLWGFCSWRNDGRHGVILRAGESVSFPVIRHQGPCVFRRAGIYRRGVKMEKDIRGNTRC